MSEGVQTCWNVCVCVCVGVSVGVVCQPLVEGTDGEDTARNAWGLSIQIQFSNAFFFWRMMFSQKSGPELGWSERAPPTKLKEALVLTVLTQPEMEVSLNLAHVRLTCPNLCPAMNISKANSI